MFQNRDFKELLSILARREVRYLVIGGYAVMRYSEPRWTKDLDLWIALDDANSERVFESLKEFGAPLTGLTAADFREPGYFYQMGRPPLRVDFLMSIPGVNFGEAWERKITQMIGDVQVHFISREDLIRNKESSGRPQDLIDAQALKRNFGGLTRP